MEAKDIVKKEQKRKRAKDQKRISRSTCLLRLLPQQI
jgi:hypothetical protein